MKHIRTINGAAQMLHDMDINCAITAHCIRHLIKAELIPYTRTGCKYLVAVEDIIAYFGANQSTD